MHRRIGAIRLLLVSSPLVLAACAGAPIATIATAPTEIATTVAPSSPLVARDILDPTIGNVDLTTRATPDLWERMRAGFAMPELSNTAAQEKTLWYAARQEYLKRSFERARPFLFHIVEEIEKRGMPTELALLPLVESAYNPRAVSPAQAAGMWQFIPSTGKQYKLQQDWWRDDRRDIMASTTAALDYLQFLHSTFKDWHLALAAYNWGEGAVGRAVEKARARGEPTDYASLKMPAETAGYVPKLQAIKNLVMNPAIYNLALPEVPNAPYLATITKTRDIDIKMAARLAEMPVDEFIALNPSHNRPVIPGANRPTLVLPVDKMETFRHNLESNQDKPLSTWRVYLTKAGEKLEQIASRFGIDLAQLKSINGIGPRARVSTGHTLIVPKDDKVAEELLPVTIDQPAFAPEERVSRTAYVVRKGDTLFGIARKYKVSADEVRRWNKLAGTGVSPGQKLMIETVVADTPGKYRIAAKNGKKHAAVKAKRSVKIARR